MLRLTQLDNRFYQIIEKSDSTSLALATLAVLVVRRGSLRISGKLLGMVPVVDCPHPDASQSGFIPSVQSRILKMALFVPH